MMCKTPKLLWKIFYKRCTFVKKNISFILNVFLVVDVFVMFIFFTLNVLETAFTKLSTVMLNAKTLSGQSGIEESGLGEER